MPFSSFKISPTDSAVCAATNSPPAANGPGTLRVSKLERAPYVQALPSRRFRSSR